MSKTVLVTGGTGYVGSWVVKRLLEDGHTVRLATRNIDDKDKFSHLTKISTNTQGKLEPYQADLLTPNSFDKAAEGADAIIHMASPFTIRIQDPLTELIEPAVKGTENVLEAANKSSTVKKVVLTSSAAAVYGDNVDMHNQGLTEFTEEHFNTTSSPKHQPYSYSKAEAERTAWRLYEEQDKWDLIVMNPTFVIGPSLTVTSNSESLNLLKEMLEGKYALGAPDLNFGFVDVRDVAEAHTKALNEDNLEGRFLLCERCMSVYDLSQIIKQKLEKKYSLPMMKSPKWMMYLVGWMFGLSVKFIRRNIGYPVRFNISKSVEKLGMKYIPVDKSVVDMVEMMESSGMINK